jgi:hypothetical protein
MGLNCNPPHLCLLSSWSVFLLDGVSLNLAINLGRINIKMGSHSTQAERMFSFFAQVFLCLLGVFNNFLL